MDQNRIHLQLLVRLIIHKRINPYMTKTKTLIIIICNHLQQITALGG